MASSCQSASGFPSRQFVYISGLALLGTGAACTQFWISHTPSSLSLMVIGLGSLCPGLFVLGIACMWTFAARFGRAVLCSALACAVAVQVGVTGLAARDDGLRVIRSIDSYESIVNTKLTLPSQLLAHFPRDIHSCGSAIAFFCGSALDRHVIQLRCCVGPANAERIFRESEPHALFRQKGAKRKIGWPIRRSVMSFRNAENTCFADLPASFEILVLHTHLRPGASPSEWRNNTGYSSGVAVDPNAGVVIYWALTP